MKNNVANKALHADSIQLLRFLKGKIVKIAPIYSPVGRALV